ncbi:MAG: choice-of-anchor D domain-containing protein [Cyclobacteriaceae bacterium]
MKNSFGKISGLLCLIACLVNVKSSAQAPGDVDGGNLNLWLKADANVEEADGTAAEDGDGVDDWRDQTANNLDASQGTAAARPTFNTNQVNGYPAISFSTAGTDDFLDLGDVLDFDPDTDDWSVFIIYNVVVNEQGTLFSRALSGTGDTRQYQYYVSGNEFVVRNRGANHASTATVTGNWSLASSITEGGTGVDTYVDGGSEISGGAIGTGTETTNVLIGARTNGTGFTLDGDIAEIIVYDNNLNASDQRDVESYLALKYGISLDISSEGYTLGATTLYAVDATFDNDIVGIGQDDSQGFNQTTSQSINTSAVIAIGSPSDQTDGEFLILGNNGSTSASQTGDYFGRTNNGSARIWKVEETGDVGTITLTINKTDLPGTVNQIYVKNADAALGTGGTLTALVDGGAVWTVNVNFSDGDYFSFVETISPGNEITGLNLWLKADADADNSGSLASEGEEVDSWTDQSANASEFTQSFAIAEGGPTFRESAVNGNPALEFIDDYFVFEDYPIMPANAFTFFSVQSTTEAATSAIVTYNVNGTDEVAISTLNDLNFEINGDQNDMGSIDFTDGFPQVLVADWNTSDDQGNVFQNGGTAVTTTFNAIASLANDGAFVIGQEADNETNGGFGGTSDISGFVTEIILFDSELTASARRNVESYLAIKYGITLDISTTGYTINGTDIYSSDATFDNDIAGIGQDDSQELNQISSQSENSTSIISVGSATDLADGEFLVWGHNGGVSTDQTGDYNGQTNTGSARIWHAEETGDVGNVTITVDKTDLPANVSSIYVINGDPTLGTGGSLTSLTDGGSTWSVSVNLADGDYFSFVEQDVIAPGDKSSGLSLWLKANAGTENNGGVVTSGTMDEWQDQSGNGNDATSGSDATLIASEINGNPAVDFNGTAELDGGAGFYTNEYFLVLQPDVDVDGSANGFAVGFQAADFSGLWIGTQTDGVVGGDVIIHGVDEGGGSYRSAYTGAQLSTANEPFVLSVHDDDGTPTFHDIFFNGATINPTLFNTFSNLSDEPYRLGDNLLDDNNYDGGIAEVISYSSRLTDADRRDVETYLAIKYGLTLDMGTFGYTISGTDIYPQDATFDNDIAGVGQDDSQELNQTSSLSESGNGVLTIGSATDLGDEEFLVWGTNGGTGTALTGDYNNGTTDGTNNGSARIWKVVQTGDVGTVTLTIDGANLPTGVTHIIVDNDSDLSSPEQVIALTGGSPFTVDVAFTDDATSYFSFIGFPEIAVSGNATNIVDGDATPDAGDDTDFGQADIAAGSVTNTFTITNSGNVALSISSVNISGSEAADFSVTSSPTSPVAAGGGTTTFDVTFNPSALGARDATITINSDDTDETAFDYAIQGTGANLPEMSIEGNSVEIVNGDATPTAVDDTDFGDTKTSIATTFTVVNDGTATLTLGSNAASVSNTTDFSVTSQPATTVAATGGTTTFEITFTPSGSGQFTSTVTVTNDDSDESPYTFTIRGTNLQSPGAVLTDLNLWLRADADADNTGSLATEGQEVDNWTDQSINGTILTQPLGVGEGGPTFRETSINSNPALEFDDDYIAVENYSIMPPDAFTFFAVEFSTATNFGGLFSYAVGTTDEVVIAELNALEVDIHADQNDIGVDFVNGIPQVMAIDFDEVSDGLNVFQNGTLAGTSTFNENTATIQNDGLVVLGQETDNEVGGGFAGGEELVGTVAEVILYASELSAADRRDVESYLAIKYGITLDISSTGYTLANGATVLYAPDATFDNDIAGIGSDIDQALTQTTSQSVNASAILQVSNAQAQASGDFLLWGTNGGAATALTGDYNGIINNGIARIWKVEETNDVGTVTLTINQADVPASINAIYVHNDPALGTGGTVTPLTDGGSTWTVDLDLSDGDYFSYITIQEMSVEGNNVEITDGDITPDAADHTDFGTTDTGSQTIVRTFTINNTGGADLILDGSPVIALSGSSDFTVTSQATSPVGANSSVDFEITFDPSAVGTVTATVSIENNDTDEDPYTFDISGTGAIIPEMLVEGSSTEIPNGDTTPSVSDDTNFGSVDVDNSDTHTFTITNAGSADLNLTGGPIVALSGATTHFSVTTQPSTPVTASGGTTTFQVQFAPTAAGVHQVTVSIDNDDSDENPYTFTLQGSGTAAGGGSSGDFDCNCVAGSSDITVTSDVILNDYFPGGADALSGTQTITLGPMRTGTGVPGNGISDGDLLLLIQMQGVEINSTLPDDRLNNSYGDGSGGNDRAGFVETEDFTAGQYEFVVVTDASGYNTGSGGTILVKNPVVNTYNHEVTQANFSSDLGRQTFQLVRVANHLNVTINGGASVNAAPWNGRTGGIIVMDAFTSLTLNGTIDVDGMGFRGGLRTTADVRPDNESPEVGYRGEGYAGTPSQTHGYDEAPVLGGSLVGATLPGAESPGYPGSSATLDVTSDLGTSPYTMTYFADRGHGGPGNAGGAGRYDGSGGGGGAGNPGGTGSYPNDGEITELGNPTNPDNEFSNQGIGGGAKDIENGARAFLGGGGGSGGIDDEGGFTQVAASGQPGGGIVILRANSITGTGGITANGQDGATQTEEGAGGGGAGGSVIIVTDTEDLNGLTLTSEGGDGSTTSNGNDAGGGGGSGGEIVIIRRGGIVSVLPTVSVVGGAAGASGAGAGVAAGGSGGFETTSLPPAANLDCPLINVPPAAPGGVAGVLVWTKADTDVTYNGSNQVSQWIDQSTNGWVLDLDAGGQLSTTGSNPEITLSDSDFNGNPSINFADATDYLGFTGFSNFPNSEIDAFVVSQTSNQSQDQTIFSYMDDADSDNDIRLLLEADGSIDQFNNTLQTTTATEIRDGIPRIVNTRYVDGNDDTEILVNNQSLATTSGTDVTLNTGLTDGTFIIGQDIDNLTDGGFSSSSRFIGEIGEVIIYPMDLTATERQRVDSYLGIKYGITLFQDQDYLNSIAETIFPGSTETVYDNDIAGIGRDDGSGLIQLQSRSVNQNIATGAILTGSKSSFAVDRSFVVWGSNGVTTPTFNATGGTPAELTDILDLEWKAYVSNTPGNIDLSFDLSNTTNQPASTAVMAIVIDEDLDGDFTTGTLRVEPYDSYDGTTASFSNIMFNDGEPFTIGVLPVAPGGVSADLTLWTKADAGTRNNGGDVTSGVVDEWVDQSTAGNDVTGTEEPTLQAADESFNFNPFLDFTAQGHLFGSNPMNTNSDGSTFLIGSNTSLTAGDVGVGFGAAATDPSLGTSGSDLRFVDDNSTPQGVSHSVALTADMTHLLGVTWINGTDQTTNLRLDGDGDNFTTMDISSDQAVHIGAEANSGSNRWDGNIAEVVVYTDDLTANELQRVESYLAIKYGITLDQSTSRDYVASNSAVIFPASSSNPDFITYSNDIAGIGRDDQSTLSQTQSKSINSDAIMTITNGNDPANPASFTNNFTFVAWGNDNDDNGTIEEVSSDLPSNVTARLDREWRASVTGTPGDLTLQFDLSGITGVGSDFSARTVADFKVLVDADGDFTDGFVQSFDATSFDSGTEIVTITGVTLGDNDIFTLSTAIPAKGPGGVTSGLQLWLRADMGAFQDLAASSDADTDGQNVLRWDDQVSSQQYTNDVFGNVSNAIPTYRTDVEGFNFNPAIQFNNDGTENDYLANATSNIWGSELSFFSVFQTNDTGGTMFSYDDDSSEPDEFAVNSTEALSFELSEGNTGSDYTDQNLSDNRTHIMALDWDEATDVYNLYIDGASEGSNPGSLTSDAIPDGGVAVIGQNVNDITTGGGQDGGFISGDGYDDFIGEFVVYDQVLTASERQRVETYLGLKYGIWLNNGNPDHVSSSGTVIFPGGNGSFDNDIAGIGRDDLSDLIQMTSKSNENSSILTVQKNTDFNADEQFVVWAHNGASVGSSVTTNLPSGIESRMGRVWQFDLTNSPTGTVDITLDLTGTSSIDTDDLRLLFDANNPSMTNSTIIDPTVVDNGDGTYTFTGIALSNFSDGGYFTLGSNDPSTPLPIELIFFAGESTDRGVQLKWATATEVNNDFFTIERSTDILNFEEIVTVSGAGNSQERLDYSYLDMSPIPGIGYYRLKQTDFDGTTSYSKVIVVTTASVGDLNMTLYPNPANDHLNVSFNQALNVDFMTVRVIPLTGKDYGEFRFENPGQISIPLSTYADGVYIAEVKIGSLVWRRRFVKRD